MVLSMQRYLSIGQVFHSPIDKLIHFFNWKLLVEDRNLFILSSFFLSLSFFFFAILIPFSSSIAFVLLFRKSRVFLFLSLSNFVISRWLHTRKPSRPLNCCGRAKPMGPWMSRRAGGSTGRRRIWR